MYVKMTNKLIVITYKELFMKLSQFVKIGTIAVVFLGAGSAMFASNKSAKAKQVKDSSESRPEATQMEKRELSEVTGKLTVLGSGDEQIITLVTDDNKAYVLTTMEKQRGPAPDDKNVKEKKENKAEDAKKEPPKNLKAKDANKKDGEKKEMKEPPKMVKTQELVALNGKKVTVKGILNKKNSALLVFEIKK